MVLQHEAAYFNEAITRPTADGLNNAYHGHSIDGQGSQDNNPDIVVDAQDTSFEPIAICGMACRLPGGIASPEQLWDFIINKKDARQRVPKGRYNVDAYYSAREKPGSVNTEYGYFLDQDLAAFDGSFFSMTPMELQRCDPQQRLLLEVAQECVEEAGEKSLGGQNVGVYVGNFGEDWNDMLENDAQQHGVYRVIGSGDFALANKVSYEMDLQGPSMTVRTACSAALVALNEACVAVSRGDCQSAIVGGASIILTPSMTIKCTEQGLLAKDGSCKAFAANADGYARAEAVNAVYIKPLANALRDGNPVRAVIRGTAANHNGKTPGISYPGAKTQEALIRRTYQTAGINNYAETGFVECHGTGTLVGDPIETTAIGNVFSDSNQPDGSIFIGSIKPNLGHGEGASGLTSLMKAVLALQHRTIPPNIKFTEPNPKIPWEKGLIVPTDAIPWPSGKKERISVNSFGFGGANAHAILESAAEHGIRTEAEEANYNPHLLVFSAKSPEPLQALVEKYSAYLSENPGRLTDLAFTLANKRAHFPHRAFIVASREQPGIASPPAKLVTPPPKVVMVFTGQGAQWPQMGRDLLRQNATFKSTIKVLDKLLQTMGSNRPDWSIEGELRKPARTCRLNLAEISQPVCTAIQIALVDCFSELGITPAAVVGHSSGEIAGAYAAGALTRQEAITAAYHRGVVAKLQTRHGAMAAIGMGWEDVKKYLEQVKNVSVACENSARSVTISGDADQVEQIVSKVQEAEPGVLARRLKVEKAYHSYHMKEIGGHYHSLISGIGTRTVRALGNEPKTLFFSSVTGELYNGELGTRYWQDNLESPVLFRTAVASLMAHPVGQHAIFLEIGPHSALAGPLRQTQAEFNNRNEYIPAMVRNQQCTESFLQAIGKLYASHVAVDFTALYPQGLCLTDLPRYSWNRGTSYWHESRVTEEYRHRKHQHHDLLGIKVRESSELEPVWRNVFHLENAPWVRDHRIGDDIVFPFAAYIGMAAEAVRQVSGIDRGVTLRDTTVTVALIVTDEKPTELITSLKPKKGEVSDSKEQWWEFSISSYSDQTGSWTSHCSGEVAATYGHIKPESELFTSSLHRRVEPEQWFEVARHGGLNFGPSFQRWTDMHTSTVQPARATAQMANMEFGDEDRYHLHPTIVDGAIQLLVVGACLGLRVKYRTNLAVGVGELTFLRTTKDLKAGVVTSIASNGNVSGQGQCVTSDGQVVLNMKGVRLSAFEEPTSADRHAAARLIWQPHVDFVAPDSMINPTVDISEDLPVLDELFKLALSYSLDAVAGASPTLPHLQRYHAWLKGQGESHLSQLHEYEGLNADVLRTEMSDRTARLGDSLLGGAALAISAVAEAMSEILSGTLNSHEVLDQDYILNRVEKLVYEHDVSKFLQTLGHTKPNVRVLELGAGMGRGTEGYLRDLGSLCSKYTFSDSTNRLFETAKNRFESVPKLEFLVLDIQKPLEDQGLEGREFDLIIANNVLHQTDDLAFSIANVRKLLHPDGRLLLHEIVPSSSSQWINYIMGPLRSWWHGSDEDGRSTEPCLSWGGWQKELRKAGLSVLNKASHDSAQQLTETIIAKPIGPPAISKEIGLLVAENASGTPVIQSALEEHGYTVTRLTLGQDPPVGQDVFCLLDQDAPFFEEMTEEKFLGLQNFVSGLSGGAGVFWITRPSSMDCKDPRFSQVLGFSRVIRSELDLDFAVCQTIPEWQSAAGSIARVLEVFEKFRLRSRREGDLLPEMEFVVKDDDVYVGRFYPFELGQELQTAQPNIDPVSLVPGRPGRLAELSWQYQERKKLEGDEVEVEVDTAGLGTRDALMASQGNNRGLSSFGVAAAGVIFSTGPTADNFSPGERVLCRAQGVFSTRITAPQQLVTKLPDDLGSADAVAFADVYTTAYCGLFVAGGLASGASVLIHDGASSIGLAAIQLACARGNDVYTTIGSAQERLLISGMDIPNLTEDRILDLESLPTIRGNGKGFDLALVQNAVCLSGGSSSVLWDSISPFGKLVDVNIGINDTAIPGGSSAPNRSYCNLNMEHVQSLRPKIISGILHDIVRLYQDGLIKPLLSKKVFSAAQVTDAFQYAALKADPSEHIVVQFQEAGGKSTIPSTTVRSRRRNPVFDPAASYLLVGGLGGLGRSVAVWMAEHGARHLVFMSRSAGSRDSDRQFAEELSSMGCEPRLVAGDVSNCSHLRRAIDLCTEAGPLRGVYQMTMILRDQSFDRMSIADWNTVVRPKVDGTWNLHNETISRNDVGLDFFVVFSSMSGLMGQPGQANYASANTFLDAIVDYRRGLGLPASAVQFGPIEDTGVIAANPKLLGQFKSSGMYLLRQGEVLDSIEVAATVVDQETETNSFTVGLRTLSPLSSPGNRLPWRRDPRMAIYHNGSKADSAAGGASNDGLKSFLSSARENPSLLTTSEAAELLANEIGRKVMTLLMMPTDEEINTGLGLTALGLDSLVGIELRQWLKATIGLDMSVVQMMSMGTLGLLGKAAAEGLAKQYAARQ